LAQGKPPSRLKVYILSRAWDSLCFGLVVVVGAQRLNRMTAFMDMSNYGAFNPKAAEFVPGHTWGVPGPVGVSGSLFPGSSRGLNPPSPDRAVRPPPGLGGSLAGTVAENIGAAQAGLVDLFPPGLSSSAASESTLVPDFLSHLASVLAADTTGTPNKAVAAMPTPPSPNHGGDATREWSYTFGNSLRSFVDDKSLQRMAPPGLESTSAGSEENQEERTSDSSHHDESPAFEEEEGTMLPPSAGSNFSHTQSACRWHRSANTVGVVSEDGHVFTKTAIGRQKMCLGSRGRPVELAALCMVFDESLRCGGTHRYHYRILDGEVGAADGAGFVFDSKVRRNNIQRMRSVFLNQRGCVCIRDHERVKKLGVRLPPLGAGMSLALHIDLDALYLQFIVYSAEGNPIGMADVSVGGFFWSEEGSQNNGSSNCRAEAKKASEMQLPGSGFFCAVVTKEVSVGLA